MLSRTITIKVVVDTVGALASEALAGNFYLLDTNRTEGSTGLGTEFLKTRVRPGDRLVWTILALECEAYVAIDKILIAPQFCVPTKETYSGTDIDYWVATVSKTAAEIPYQLSIRLGTRSMPMITEATPVIISKE